jgi:hypothetical protein
MTVPNTAIRSLHWEGAMSRMRTLTISAVLVAASMLLGMPVLSASAQQAEPVARQGVRLPACDPSMIVGTWQAAFAYGTPIYGTAQNNGFSCPLNVAANGTITSGTCILGSGITVSPVPSGMVTIDRSCHVAGSITFGYCNPGRSCVNSWQMSVSLWRSADGSRLTGTQVLTCPKCKSVQDQAVTWVSPFEMIAGQ